VRRTGIALWDLDSTVFDTSPRHAYFPPEGPTRDWIGYSRMCHLDIAVMPIVKLAQVTNVLLDNFILSARIGDPEVFATTKRKLGEVNFPYEQIFLMPPHQQHTVHHVEFKRRKATNLKELGYDIVIAFEDNPECQEMYHSLGIPTVLVTPPYVSNLLRQADPR
jgi:hypothetical protein